MKIIVFPRALLDFFVHVLYIVMQFDRFVINLQEINRQHQHCMTNDPNKVWPHGILPYTIDRSIGKNACFSVD